MNGNRKASFPQNCKKGFGDFPNLRSRENAKPQFFGEKFFRFSESAVSFSAVKGAAFAQYFCGEKILFCSVAFAIDKTDIG